MTLNFQSASAFVGILVGLGYLFEYFEKTVRDTAREELILWIKKVAIGSFSDILSSCSRLFLGLFDHVYFAEKSAFRPYVWGWLTGMFVVSLTIVPFNVLWVLRRPSLDEVLIYGGVTGFLYSLVAYAYLQRRLLIRRIARLTLVGIVGFATLSAFLLLIGRMYGYGASLPFSWVPFTVLIGVSAIMAIDSSRGTLARFSPFRAMLTSLGAVSLIGLVGWDMVRGFISDISLYGWSISGYLLLNICVDSFSLLETRFVLKLASRGSFVRFFGVVILDILASATIFLAIPIASGNLHIFLDAIAFKGPQPWIGILFWSSFSTSVFFYLYLLSAGALAGLHAFVKGFLKLDRFLPISERPFRCLGLVAMVITTLIFLVLSCIL